MANPATYSQAIQNAPHGTSWHNGNYSVKKTVNSSDQTVFVAADGVRTDFLQSRGDVTSFMQTHAITTANNPAYSIIPAPKSVPKKTPSQAPNTPAPPTTDSANATISPSDITVYASAPSVNDISQAQANGTADLGIIATANIPGGGAGLPGRIPSEQQVISIASQQDSANFNSRADWRVRLSLSPESNYLYNSTNPGILAPLKATDGVIFPYTPSISVSYSANYNPGVEAVHSNYKIYQYSSSAVENVQLTCEFTAQDTFEANYILATIHFFRTMTKMFYGQDQNPKHGTPPPLCYLFGLGTYQFSAHPLAITGFTYNLPNDVDYIKTTSSSLPGTTQPTPRNTPSASRLPLNIQAGGTPADPRFLNKIVNLTEVTWVPTKIQLSISCVPIQSRNQVSNIFSLEKYGRGTLLNGIGKSGGAFW